MPELSQGSGRDEVIGDADVQEIVEASEERSEVFSGTILIGVASKWVSDGGAKFLGEAL